MPLVALTILYRTIRDHNEKSQANQYFLILYQGLHQKHFYWEFINSLKKLTILISFTLPTAYQIVFPSMVLIATWRLQNSLKPYKLLANNEIEILGVNVALITLCSGLIFDQENDNKSLNKVLLLLIVGGNVLFFLKWAQMMWDTLGTRYQFLQKVSNLLDFLSCQNWKIYNTQKPSNGLSRGKARKVIKKSSNKKFKHGRKLIRKAKNRNKSGLDSTDRDLLNQKSNFRFLNSQTKRSSKRNTKRDKGEISKRDFEGMEHLRSSGIKGENLEDNFMTKREKAILSVSFNNRIKRLEKKIEEKEKRLEVKKCKNKLHKSKVGNKGKKVWNRVNPVITPNSCNSAHLENTGGSKLSKSPRIADILKDSSEEVHLDPILSRDEEEREW